MYLFKISWRYLFSKRKGAFINLITVISILGIAIGVAALIIVISVMNGFDKDLKDKIVGSNAHIIVESPGGIIDYDNLVAEIETIKQIDSASAFISGQVVFLKDKNAFALNLKGVDPEKEKQVSSLSRYIEQGSFELSDNEIIIGRELALYMGIDLNDTIKIVSPILRKTFELKVKGIFSSGMYDYDLSLVLVSLSQAQKIFDMENLVSGISVKTDDLFIARRVRESIYQTIGSDYVIRTWMDINKNFFAALKLEKITMFIILTLIILVASFNIISALIVMVVDRTKDIGILKALGVTNRGIRRLFTFEGVLVGGFGITAGLGIGFFVCWLLKKFQFIKLPSEIYYIDRLPVSIKIWPDIGLIVISAFLIVLISSFYPAFKASRLNPVDALRYE
ncbi:MAG: ABC transporter permease [Candidatus Gygaella obscura]|nr:ABC transporter permease [Candidatus Gygaella obscura]